MEGDDYTDLVAKYKQKVAEEFGEKVQAAPKVTSREYSEFKDELFPTSYSWYEKACNWSDNVLKLSSDPVKQAKVIDDLKTCHLNTTPGGVTAFAILAALAIMFVGSFAGFIVPLLLIGRPMMFLIVFSIVGGMVSIPILQRVPGYMANSWRMKSSNQMVQSVFYMVTYMRHTSNLERAIGFAADHLDAPLSLDFRKILWDVETQEFSSVRDSAESFLSTWKEYSKEFVEAFHLVESSLYEGSDERRLTLLDKSLEVILNGTYENMLHYAHNLKGPMTMLHMLGVILPILGLVILPLVVSFMSSGGSPLVMAIYISLLYNITLPMSVFLLGKNILSKRPAGYGASDIGQNKGVKKFENVLIPLGGKVTIAINPLYFSLMVLAVTFLIGFSPMIIHVVDPTFEIVSGSLKFMDYVCPPEFPTCDPGERIGPYGIGASLLSLVLIGGVGLSIGLYYRLRSSNVIKIRNKTKDLEQEFSSALFQLGNRLGDGIPAEMAFAKIATQMDGTTTGDFFNLAEKNVTKLGMGIEQAVFDPKVGAIASFPSKVIESSMKVLIESLKKGPAIAAQALLSMSRYMKEIHRVEERLRDLMADIIGSMKAQVKFLTPAIAGIVIGITSMISTILTRLSAQLSEFAGGGENVGSFGDLLSIFGIGIPTFHFQIVVGVYIIQIVYILTVLASGIENGADKLGERFSLGRNMVRSVMMYCFIAGIVMILFNLFAGSILRGTLGG